MPNFIPHLKRYCFHRQFRLRISIRKSDVRLGYENPPTFDLPTSPHAFFRTH